MLRKLTRRFHWLVLGFALTVPMAAIADHDDMLADDPDATEADIALPDEAADEARANAEYGLRQANEARDKQRVYGEARAEAAGGNRDSGARD